MPSIGLELRRERELRGVALSDISKITKISLNFLHALEEDRLNILPGEFFIKGMIRAYAKCIGLDEDQALNLYQHSLQQKELDQVHEKHKRESPILRSRKPHTFLVVVAAAILLAVSVMIIMGFALKKTTARARESAQPKLPALTAAPSLPAPRLPPAVSVEKSAEELSLQLTFQQETWILVKADGRTVLDQVKQPGELTTLTCRQEFIVNTGNAGGFSYTLNNRAGKPLGGPGKVVKNVRIGLDNFRDYLGAQ
jgi:cytoskeleton protein RodZ